MHSQYHTYPYLAPILCTYHYILTLCTHTLHAYIHIHWQRHRMFTLHMALNLNTVLHHCAHTDYIHTSTYITVAISRNVYIMPCSPQGEHGMMLSPAEPLGTLGMDQYYGGDILIKTYQLHPHTTHQHSVHVVRVTTIVSWRDPQRVNTIIAL